MLSSLAKGPRTYSVLLGGEGHSSGCPGVIQRAAVALLVGTGHEAKPGRARESSLCPPHPSWGLGILSV